LERKKGKKEEVNLSAIRAYGIEVKQIQAEKLEISTVEGSKWGGVGEKVHMACGDQILKQRVGRKRRNLNVHYNQEGRRDTLHQGETGSKVKWEERSTREKRELRDLIVKVILKQMGFLFGKRGEGSKKHELQG